MSGFKYTFAGGDIESTKRDREQKWDITFNGVFQYTLGENTVFIQRLTKKQLNIPEWDESPEAFDTFKLKLID